MNDSKPRLHVIAFDVPDPPNYGGVIDVFYRIESFVNAGIGVVLHTFDYSRKKSAYLSEICEEVHYYPRKMGLPFPLNRPWIVSSRESSALLQTLIDKPFPIWFEGVHTTGFIRHPKLADRLRMVRLHNVEAEYYKALAKSEPNIAKRIYLHVESRLLVGYERNLPVEGHYFLISESDRSYFGQYYPNCRVLPPFHGFKMAEYASRKGNYLMVQGNFMVAENYRATRYLIETVFNRIPVPVLIAGLGANRLLKFLSSESQIRIIDSPDENSLQAYSAEAGAHVLFTHQPSGFKLKLLHALYSGRPVIANDLMVSGTGLESLCVIASSSEEIGKAAIHAIEQGLSQEAYAFRSAHLAQRFSNQQNVEFIKDLLLRSR